MNLSVRRLELPLVLTAIHSVLIGMATYIQYGAGWDEESPTILVAVVLRVTDLPVAWLMHWLGLDDPPAATFFALMVLLGGVLWFLVGYCMSFLLGPPRAHRMAS